MSAYFDFIEEMKNTIQFGRLEEHHIYPKFDRQTDEVIYLSLNAHADASVYQSEEWGRGCIHRRQHKYVSPHLKNRSSYWLGDGLRNWWKNNRELAIETSALAGTISAQNNPHRDYSSMAKKGNKAQRESLGVDGMREIQSRAGTAGCKITNSQRYRCKETGFVSTAAGVVSYQKGQKISTSLENREKING